MVAVNAEETDAHTALVGVDTGGTFVDLLLLRDDGATFVRKVPAGSDAEAALRVGLLGLAAEARVEPTSLVELAHGTTVATNAVLERRGARTGLVTTEGFRDVLELGRIRLPELYNLRYVKPVPLVDRSLRIGVGGRLTANGSELEPVDRAEVRRRVEALHVAGVEAVAVCLLNAWASADHEEEVAAAISTEHPGTFLSVSSRIAPELGEYERTSTTVVNAYVGPTVERYVRELHDALRSSGIGCRVLVMQSDGSVVDDVAARVRPIALLESGPAAGAVGASEVAGAAGVVDAVTFDMGGTTAKASLIEAGRLSTTAQFEVGGSISAAAGLLVGDGHPVRLAALDLAEIGVGGGSLVRVDRAGSLVVGPESAGADPGPACYGFGGRRTTVTDANAVLGYLRPDGLAGGSVAVDIERARVSVDADVAGPLAATVVDAAAAVHAVANATMVPVVRTLTTWRGRDPRAFALIAFGGNGALHAAGVAELLGMRRVVVPPRPGLLSALGLLVSPHRHRRTRAVWKPLDSLAGETLDGIFDEEESRLRAELARVAAEPAFERSVDLRYVGQGHELTIAVDGEPANAVVALSDRFAESHRATYGHAFEGVPIELVNVRVSAQLPRAPAVPPAPVASPARAAVRRAYFRGAGVVDVDVVVRSALVDPRPGPLLVDEYDTTIVVPPGWHAALDRAGNVVLDAA